MDNDTGEDDGFVKFIKELFPQWLDDEYEFWDYKSILPHPLEYDQFVNFIISKVSTGLHNGERGRIRDLFDARWLIPNHHLVAKFALSLPIVTHRIVNASYLPFRARAQTYDVKHPDLKILKSFGKQLKLGLNAVNITEFPDCEIRNILSEAIDSRYPYCLFELLSSRYKQFNRSVEVEIDFYLDAILHPICDSLHLKLDAYLHPIPIKGSPLVPKSSGEFHTLAPNKVVMKDGRIICPVSVKMPTLFNEEERVCPSFHSLCHGEMREIMFQLQTYIIVTKSKYGILTDGYYLIVIEFDYDPRKPEETSDREQGFVVGNEDDLVIPLKAKILNAESSCPTFLEMLAFILYKAANDDGVSEFYEYLPTPVKLRDEPCNQEEDDSRKRLNQEAGGRSNNKNRRVKETRVEL